MASPLRWLRRLFAHPVTAHRRGPKNWNCYRLRLEHLEDRLAPATDITVITGTYGTGTLDHLLTSSTGTIAATDVTSDTNGTLTYAALETPGPAVNLSITSPGAITFTSA